MPFPNASLLTGPQPAGDLQSILNAQIVAEQAGGVGPAGGFSMAPRNCNIAGSPAQLAADGNNSTPVITEIYISEIFVPANFLVTGVAVFNGSDVTGSIMVGLANSRGTVVAASAGAGTAGSGTDAYQRVPFTTPYNAYGPATYYILTAYSSGTARYNTFAVGNHGCSLLAAQTFGTFPAAITPPTTFVTAIGNIAGLY